MTYETSQLNYFLILIKNVLKGSPKSLGSKYLEWFLAHFGVQNFFNLRERETSRFLKENTLY